jgi:hypothetical protein
MEEGMSKFDRRHMLKVMAATAAGAAGAALSGSGIESVMAATPNPGGPFLGSSPSTATNAPLVASTANTTYQSYPGLDFDAGFSTSTWAVSGTLKAPTNGGFYARRIELPQGAVLTECKFFFSNPTNTPDCHVLQGSLDGTFFASPGNGTAPATSAAVQTLNLTMSPLAIDNSQYWYDLDFEPRGATDTTIFGARIGWLLNPGLTLFPNPRRVVDGFATPFTSGTTYGPFDATQQVYPTAAPSGVPAGAKAAFCAVQSYTAGVLTIFPDLTTDPNIANFTAVVDGPLNLFYMMVPLSPAGKFKIHSYITGKVSVDAWGYLV